MINQNTFSTEMSQILKNLDYQMVEDASKKILRNIPEVEIDVVFSNPTEKLLYSRLINIFSSNLSWTEKGQTVTDFVLYLAGERYKMEVLKILNTHQIKEETIIDDSSIIKIFDEVILEVSQSKIEKKFIEIIVYDLNQSKSSFINAQYKSCIVMLGASLEGLMLGTIQRGDIISKIKNEIDMTKIPANLKNLGIHNPNFIQKIGDNLGFEDYKNIIFYLNPEVKDLRVIDIQDFRNSVHPWKVINNPAIFKNPNKYRAAHYITGFYEIARKILLT